MPPENKDQPSLQQRDDIVRWIDDNIFWMDPAKPDPGQVTRRRLNRAEYNNTIRDLLHLDSRPADAFPPDDSGYGFDTIGDVLSISPMLMEKYVRAAFELAEAATTLQESETLEFKIDGKRFYNHQSKSGEEFLQIFRSSVEQDDRIYRTLNYTVLKNGLPQLADKIEIVTSPQFLAEYSAVYKDSPLYFGERINPKEILRGVGVYLTQLKAAFGE
jgi:hypothetical protein